MSNQCPACGSVDHDGWTNHKGCPEDWNTMRIGSFEHRRWLQLTNERNIEAVTSSQLGAAMSELVPDPSMDREVIAAKVQADLRKLNQTASPEVCADCGCWTGGADCPYCIPGAPHPRGRWIVVRDG